MLDTLSAEPGQGRKISNFVEAGLTKWAFAPQGASLDDVIFDLSIDIEKHEDAYFTGSVRTS